MTWEQRLLDLFDDLEQRAEGLALTERDAEVAELARAEYAEVDLASRLHASVGRPVEVRLLAVGPLRGRLAGVGEGWCLLSREDGVAEEWVVATRHVMGLRGLDRAARAASLRPVTARLGIGSVLRRLVERQSLVVVTADGERRSGGVARVGADFLELDGDRGVELVPFGALVALRAL